LISALITEICGGMRVLSNLKKKKKDSERLRSLLQTRFKNRILESKQSKITSPSNLNLDQILVLMESINSQVTSSSMTMTMAMDRELKIQSLKELTISKSCLMVAIMSQPKLEQSR
jgi:hypothetical protein